MTNNYTYGTTTYVDYHLQMKSGLNFYIWILIYIKNFNHYTLLRLYLIYNVSVQFCYKYYDFLYINYEFGCTW